jgi:hypothetical protein
MKKSGAVKDSGAIKKPGSTHSQTYHAKLATHCITSGKIEGDDVSEDEAELPSFKKPEVVANGANSDKATADLPSYMQILTNKIVVSKTERTVDAGPTKPLIPLERAKLVASKVDGRLSRKGTIHFGQPVDNKGPDAGAFHSTIEINDFPQKACWAQSTLASSTCKPPHRLERGKFGCVSRRTTLNASSTAPTIPRLGVSRASTLSSWHEKCSRITSVATNHALARLPTGL